LITLAPAPTLADVHFDWRLGVLDPEPRNDGESSALLGR
jgi:hypothetical protein